MSVWDVLLWAGMFLFYVVCIMLETPFQSQFVPWVAFYLLWCHFWPLKVIETLPLLISCGTLAQSSVQRTDLPFWALRPVSAESFCVVFSHPGSLVLQGKWLYLAWRCTGQNSVLTETEKYDGPWDKECTDTCVPPDHLISDRFGDSPL